jgi:hypothetical protein
MPDTIYDLSRLPEIYWRLLAAYPAINPYRHEGDSLALQTLYAHLRDEKSQQNLSPWSLHYVRQAVDQLQANGVVQVHDGIFVKPTLHGEGLIAEIRRHMPLPASPPAFPEALSAHLAERQ